MSRVLLVEDDPGHRLLVEERLRLGGFEVAACASLGDARARLAGGVWDAVLLDRRLPDGDGLDLVAEMRRTSPEPPVILITAAGGEEVAVRALRDGADDYLTKDPPLAYLDALPGMVERMIDRARERQASRALEDRARQHERIEAYRETLLGLSDKLNNRLAGVLGYLELIAQGLTPGEAQLRQQVERARTAARRSAEILNTLLEHTVGLEQIRVHPMRAQALLAPVRERYPEVCPPESELAQIPAPLACEQLAQALLALVHNAVEASGGTQGVRVTIAPARGAAWIEVRVEDRGEGIPPENLPKVMLPFFTTRGTQPAGLGLWTAYQIVTHVGGRLSIASTPGKGTTVRLSLPLERVPEVAL